MTTFDRILPIAIQTLEEHHAQLTPLDWLVMNRDPRIQPRTCGTTYDDQSGVPSACKTLGTSRLSP